jgi:peptidoglycan hydrolase CwlO-like protein
MRFHDFDPWEYLNNLHLTQIEQQKNISTIVAAHNTQQQQVHEVMLAIQRQAQEIRQLQAEILALRLNIRKENGVD